MRFKQYLNECECETQEDVGEASSVDHSEVNFRLADALDKIFLSPESGIMAIRMVLASLDIEMPALYGANPEGEEIVIDLDGTNLYLIYSLTDDNRYEFYAEVGDEERMEELMSDEENDEEE
jgi:hypothetical protein